MVIMKKLILTAIILLSFKAQSQSRLGFSYSEILTEFKAKYEYTTGYSEDLGKYLRFDMLTADVTYYFHEDNTCYTVILIPDSEEDMHSYVEKYNSKYTIIDDANWKAYSNGSVVNIELLYAENGGYFFLFF
jgi:hypothetical protein